MIPSVVATRDSGFSRSALCALLLTLVLCPALLAQTDLSTIRGTVTDPTGAVIPGVTITLLNTETSISRTVETNDAGDYEIPLVGPGNYQLTAEADGFQTFVASDILITSRETRRLAIELALGTVATEITVSAGAAVIETEGSQITGGFNNDDFIESPMSYSFFPHAQMMTQAAVQTNSGGWGIRIAGQGRGQAQQQMDGVANDGILNLVNNMNDFEELKVQTSGQSAEFSRSVGLTMTGKSGGNDFHGRFYYDLLNSGLNARNTFEARKTPFKQHRYGLNVNGPIFKNKTFFYFGYSAIRIPSGSFRLINVAPVAFRSGDFSSVSDPVMDPTTGQPFPNNQVPTTRFSDISRKVQEEFQPTPNRGDASTRANNFEFVHPYPQDILKWDSITPRVDHHFGNKNNLYVRFINRITPYILARDYPWATWTRERDHHNIVVADTHIFSSNLVNEFRWGWIKDYIIDGTTIEGVSPVFGDDVVQRIGLQGVNPQGLSAMGFPRMDITGLQPMRVRQGGVVLDERNFHYSNSTTWTKGRHVMKFGAQLRTFRDFDSTVKEGTYGNFNFDGRITGEPYADFLLGIPGRSRRVDPLTNRTRTSYESGFFFTDTFKVSQALTVDWGLRWDYFGATTYNDGLQFNWDPSTGNVVVPQAALSSISPLYPDSISVVGGEVVPTPKNTNFRPRIGIAYRFANDLVIRGGYGQFSEYFGRFARGFGGGPFEIQEDYRNQIINGQPLFAFPNPFPDLSLANVPSQNISGYPLDTNNGVIHQFNLSVEKQVKSMGLRVSYLGSRNRGMNYSINTNKPAPSLEPFSASRRVFTQFVTTSFWRDNGAGNYNALQFKVNRRMGDVQMDAHYTYSSNMSNMLNRENPYAQLLWNREAFNSRHRSVINISWDIPVGRGKKALTNAPGVVDAILGGWKLSWISFLQSGQFFSPSFSGADPSNTNSFGGLPDRINDGNLSAGSREITRWFDASAFAPPPAGRFGNSGLNILEGPGWNLHHLGMLKRFNITENVTFMLQGLFQNLPNHPHYRNPAANISRSGQVGIITGTKGGTSGGRERASNRFIFLRGAIEF